MTTQRPNSTDGEKGPPSHSRASGVDDRTGVSGNAARQPGHLHANAPPAGLSEPVGFPYDESVLSWQLPDWLQPPQRSAGPQRVAILGSTGSIGQSTLNVLRHDLQQSSDRHRYRLIGISGHSQIDELASIAHEFQCPRVVCTSTDHASRWRPTDSEYGGQFACGDQALGELASASDVDTVVAAIVGSAGLPSTFSALRAGKTVALANKETLVVTGHLATRQASQTGARLLPVDSEHSAIFQALLGRPEMAIRRIILTASGGPFRGFSQQQLESATREQALAHPTWNMGSKISVDSATMMNKALEIIEARWLFDIPAERIQVVVHPQSIVHSLVEFADGSVLAQMSPPDMQLPIQFALDYPARFAGPAPRMDFSEAFQLEFHPPDMDRFPALLLGLEVARRGGTTGAVLNAANEIAVEAFLGGQIRFTQIAQACRQILDQHHFDANPSLDELLKLDDWARQETRKWISN